ncbi:hypothetical protein TM7_0543, partial [candidate division TM7 genomosp. GTL1]
GTKLIASMGLLMVALVAVVASVNSSLLQPVAAASLAFDSAADAQLSTQTPNTPNGADIKMTACGTGTPVCSVDNVNEKRGLVKFNVSGVTTRIVSAKLRFYVANKPVPALQIKQTTTTSWQESTATWNNAANLPTTPATYTSPAGSVVGWYEVDVTGAVPGNGTFSFMFMNSTSTATRIATKETTTKPQLVLTTSDQTPLDGMNTYFGTTHVHTGGFNDHGDDTSSPADIFSTAKATGYNFTVLTEHSGSTGPTDGPAFYADAQAQAAAYSEDSKFIGLAGYEYSDNGGDGDTDNGHLTGWGTQEFLSASEPGNDFNAFYNTMLANKNVGRPVFGGFNHPEATGHPASAASFLTPERRDFMVMSETSNKVAYDSTLEAQYYQGFVAELDRGWRVAPTCGLDSHGLFGLQQVESATKKPCRTGVLATSLTKDSLLDAFMQRRMYSTRDMNLHLSYKVNDAWMGSKVGTPTNAAFNIAVSDPDTAAAEDNIKKIEIIGSGGAILASQTFDAHNVTWQPTIPVGANKYIFARVYNGERTEHTAVGAPVWFE